VHSFGWRQAAFGCGIAFIVVGLPLALLVRRSPESMGLEPDGDAPTSAPADNAGAHASSHEEADFTLRQALRTSAFWFITAGTAIRVIILSAINVHYVALMVWTGMSQQRAAVFLAAQAFMALPSHLFFGWLGDKVSKPKLMATCMLLATASMILLGNNHSEWAILVFTALFSAVESTFPVNWSTVGEYFGRKNFAKIRGSMSFVSTWGSVIGPVAAGAIYDRTQSYDILIWACAVLLLGASASYAMVKKPLGVKGEALGVHP
jgi:sugar phosphate permease